MHSVAATKTLDARMTATEARFNARSVRGEELLRRSQAVMKATADAGGKAWRTTLQQRADRAVLEAEAATLQAEIETVKQRHCNFTRLKSNFSDFKNFIELSDHQLVKCTLAIQLS